ncbi:hypothetical protein, partial [Bacillus velezensis]
MFLHGTRRQNKLGQLDMGGV